jgi:hypothetical protein
VVGSAVEEREAAVRVEEMAVEATAVEATAVEATAVEKEEALYKEASIALGRVLSPLRRIVVARLCRGAAQQKDESKYHGISGRDAW